MSDFEHRLAAKHSLITPSLILCCQGKDMLWRDYAQAWKKCILYNLSAGESEFKSESLSSLLSCWFWKGCLPDARSWTRGTAPRFFWNLDSESTPQSFELILFRCSSLFIIIHQQSLAIAAPFASSETPEIWLMFEVEKDQWSMHNNPNLLHLGPDTTFVRNWDGKNSSEHIETWRNGSIAPDCKVTSPPP